MYNKMKCHNFERSFTKMTYIWCIEKTLNTIHSNQQTCYCWPKIFNFNMFVLLDKSKGLQRVNFSLRWLAWSKKHLVKRKYYFATVWIWWWGKDWWSAFCGVYYMSAKHWLWEREIGTRLRRLLNVCMEKKLKE